MGVVDWIDEVTALWGTISDGKGGKVTSYRLFQKANFPESLSKFPCALTYLSDLATLEYSASGPSVMIWQGVTEFHLAPNVSKGNYPYIMQFPDRIIEAAAGSMKLNGKVSYFVLGPQEPVKFVTLQYGSEEPHLGLVVSWQTKTMGSFAVSA